MSSPGLACNELVELVTDYLEGALSPEQRARFNAHLAECEGCTNYLAQMHATIHLSSLLSEDDLAPDVRDQLLRVFRDWKREQP